MSAPERQAPRIVIAVNDGWNAVNFRGGLIRALDHAGFNVIVFAPDGPFASEIRAMGAEFCPVPMAARGASPIADLGIVLNYVRRLRAISPAAVLGFTAKPNIYGSIAARICAIPSINNISGLGTIFIRQGVLARILVFLYRIALRRSAVVFFQNRDDQALFEQKHLVSANQARLLPGSGVDLTHFVQVAKLDCNDRPFTFLLGARLLWEKGVGEFVEAARTLRAQGRSARFQILGALVPEGPAAVGEAELRAWEAEGVVEYLGSVKDVRPALAQADCIVLPSYREGLPRTLLEAAAMGIPTITTDVPGCRDAIDEGVTGLLCHVRSSESLAEAMDAMLARDPSDRLRMGTAGRKKMELQFREEIVFRAYIDALADLGIVAGGEPR
jgi:glycosyltransferase involved in cell wall biosynthesis